MVLRLALGIYSISFSHTNWRKNAMSSLFDFVVVLGALVVVIVVVTGLDVVVFVVVVVAAVVVVVVVVVVVFGVFVDCKLFNKSCISSSSRVRCVVSGTLRIVVLLGVDDACGSAVVVETLVVVPFVYIRGVVVLSISSSRLSSVESRLQPPKSSSVSSSSSVMPVSASSMSSNRPGNGLCVTPLNDGKLLLVDASRCGVVVRMVDSSFNENPSLSPNGSSESNDGALVDGHVGRAGPRSKPPALSVRIVVSDWIELRLDEEVGCAWTVASLRPFGFIVVNDVMYWRPVLLLASPDICVDVLRLLLGSSSNEPLSVSSFKLSKLNSSSSSSSSLSMSSLLLAVVVDVVDDCLVVTDEDIGVVDDCDGPLLSISFDVGCC